MVKKSTSGDGAPSLDILAAKLRIVEAELTLEEKEIHLDSGRSFVAEPNLNCKIEVVKNLVNPGQDEGVKFYDRFKLKQDDDEWAFLRYSKLGNLIVVAYGEDWFADPEAEFNVEDFEGFEFIGQVEPKTDPKGKPLAGSVVNCKGMRPAGGAVEKKAKAEAEALKETEEDFSDIPF